MQRTIRTTESAYYVPISGELGNSLEDRKYFAKTTDFVSQAERDGSTGQWTLIVPSKNINHELSTLIDYIGDSSKTVRTVTYYMASRAARTRAALAFTPQVTDDEYAPSVWFMSQWRRWMADPHEETNDFIGSALANDQVAEDLDTLIKLSQEPEGVAAGSREAVPGPADSPGNEAVAPPNPDHEAPEASGPVQG